MLGRDSRVHASLTKYSCICISVMPTPELGFEWDYPNPFRLNFRCTVQILMIYA
jgi:hypothetical protein